MAAERSDLTRISSVPRPSEVCFSSRGTRPDALQAAKSFQATRLSWSYSLDRRFLQSFRDAGLSSLGGAINACMPDRFGSHSFNEGRMVNRAGKQLTAPWMAGEPIKRNWGCPNNPAYENILLTWALALLTAGADELQFDDAGMSINAAKWGACWCSFCEVAARQEGLSLSTEMDRFQTLSTRAFVMRLRSRLDKAAGRRVTMSLNNGGGSLGEPHDLFDYGMCELGPEHLSAAKLGSLYQRYERVGWHQVATMRSTDQVVTRAAIATIHASGGNAIVPWDVYLGPGGRYFGETAVYGSLYRMVRLLGRLLDGKVFSSRPVAEYLDPVTLAVLDRMKVGTILREDDRAVVLHLVPWSGEPSPFDVTFSTAASRQKPTLIVESGQARQITSRNVKLPGREWSAVAFLKT